MALSPGARKLALAAHLSVSIGWIGAAFAYLAVGVAAETSENTQTVRASWIAMELIGWWVIVPLSVAALTSGLVMALGTRWGLFRHYWVLFSLALTSFAAVVLILHMPTVSSNADQARTASTEQLDALGGDVGHPAIGVGVLLATLALNVYKPRGLTSYGQHKQDERRTDRPEAP